MAPLSHLKDTTIMNRKNAGYLIAFWLVVILGFSQLHNEIGRWIIFGFSLVGMMVTFNFLMSDKEKRKPTDTQKGE